MKQIRATVSGSFTRHLSEIQNAVADLSARGVTVLSPEQPTIVDSLNGFVFIASDRHRSIRLVQDRHLSSIAISDFLWVENPDGHVGQSAALEIGFAIASGVPIYSNSLPNDLTMRQYVTQVANVAAAIAAIAKVAHEQKQVPVSLLVDPYSATDLAAAGIDRLRSLLGQRSNALTGTNLHSVVSAERNRVVKALELPVQSLE